MRSVRRGRRCRRRRGRLNADQRSRVRRVRRIAVVAPAPVIDGALGVAARAVDDLLFEFDRRRRVVGADDLAFGDLDLSDANLFDVTPTVLDLMDVDVDADFDGESLLS